jgi:hypothetical protein
MKKRIFVLFTVFMLMASVCPSFADRNVSTIKAYTATTLIKRGDWKVYRITYVATANGGTFTLYDALSGLGTSVTTVKTEGSEATSLNGKTLDFTGKPLEGSTGLYLYISNATVVISYE